MTICERFDVAVVLFPFIDRARAKPRPALVLSTRTFNAAQRATVMAMITTAAYTRWPSDIAISESAESRRVKCKKASQSGAERERAEGRKARRLSLFLAK